MGKKSHETAKNQGKRPDNIIPFDRKRAPLQVNISIILLIFIAFYLIFHFFSYITRRDVAVYEVVQGTLTVDNSYKGLIIRDESVIFAGQTGKLDHYLPETGKASINTLICSIDENGQTSNELHENAMAAEMTDSAYNSADLIIEEFIENYSRLDYARTYSLNNEMNTVFTSIYNDTAQAMIYEGQTGPGFNSYIPTKPTTVSYMIDGLEYLTIDNFTEAHFTESSSDMKNYFTQDEVQAGMPLYKTINSETWYVVIKVDKSMAKTLEDEKVVKVHFKEDDTYTNAYSSYVEKDGQLYGILRFNNSLVRYLPERYINLEIVLTNKSGLKIPNSSIVEKSFYIIPETVFVYGSNSKEPNLVTRYLNENEEPVTKTITPNLYFEDEQGYYIDKDELPEGCVIIPPGSTEGYTPSKTSKLIGVYNINKGYSVFKMIDIIYQSEDYTIVKTGTEYGLALYDHILLDADGMSANVIIYE